MEIAWLSLSIRPRRRSEITAAQPPLKGVGQYRAQLFARYALGNPFLVWISFEVEPPPVKVQPSEKCCTNHSVRGVLIGADCDPKTVLKLHRSQMLTSRKAGATLQSRPPAPRSGCSRRRTPAYPRSLTLPAAGPVPLPPAPETPGCTRRLVYMPHARRRQNRQSRSRSARSSRERGRHAADSSTCLCRYRVFSVVSN